MKGKNFEKKNRKNEEEGENDGEGRKTGQGPSSNSNFLHSLINTKTNIANPKRRSQGIMGNLKIEK